MHLKGIVNNLTGEIIYSRARHDFHWDKTKTIAIDGGQTDYVKVVGLGWSFVDFDLDDVTPKQLFTDWNEYINKLGSIDKNNPSVKNLVISSPKI